MNSDDFRDLIQQRRSTRDFRPDPIPTDVLDAILDDARHCPSWSNTRPYALAVASGEQANRPRAAYQKAFDDSLGLQHKTLRGIAGAVLRRRLPNGDFNAWKPYPADLKPRAFAVGKSLYEMLGVARDDRVARDAANRLHFGFFGAPTVLLLFVHGGLLPFSAHDAGLMLQTLILSAKSRDVDSCALGSLSIWRHPADAEFDIPKQYKLITGLALGYGTDAAINKFRAEHPPVMQLPSRT